MTVDDDRADSAPEFDFSGGALCLDFTNTVGNRGRPEPREMLHGFRDLAAWFEQAGLLDAPAAHDLRAWAARRPADAAALLGRARGLRESIYAVFTARARGEPPDAAVLAALNL